MSSTSGLLCVLLLAVLYAGVSTQPAPPTGKQCPKIEGQPGCVCNHSEYGVINLTRLANNNGMPRFTGLSDGKYNYMFNPCYTFDHSGGGCNQVYVCQSNFANTAFYDVANGDEQIWISDTEDNTPYLYYTGPDRRNTRVFLYCDQSVTGEPEITTTGDNITELTYVRRIGSALFLIVGNITALFYLRSSKVCFGPPSTPSESAAGPVGLALIFIFLGIVIAYFIIGAVIMKVKFDATGTDIIPNKAFWFGLPLLIKDGVMFVVSPCINAVRAKSGGYKPA